MYPRLEAKEASNSELETSTHKKVSRKACFLQPKNQETCSLAEENLSDNNHSILTQYYRKKTNCSPILHVHRQKEPRPVPSPDYNRMPRPPARLMSEKTKWELELSFSPSSAAIQTGGIIGDPWGAGTPLPPSRSEEASLHLSPHWAGVGVSPSVVHFDLVFRNYHTNITLQTRIRVWKIVAEYRKY